MRILLINQFFWPDTAATSQLLTDLAVGLSERGHEVHAICADRGYALAESGTSPQVTIHRVRSLGFSRGTLDRVLSYLSFYLGATWLGLTGPGPDLVLTLTTPPLLSVLGTAIKSLRGSEHFIWEMDVYPDIAVSLGTFKPGGILDRLVGALADFSRRRADGILALGECMKARLVARGIRAKAIHVAENWADSVAIQPVERPASSGDKLVVLYSGNLGLAHDVDTIAGAMQRLKADDRFSFVFTGGGPRRGQLAGLCEREGLSSVAFRPYVQRANLGESLGQGDIGLVTQMDVSFGAVVPSKVYGLLAAARPILFIGPEQATPARMIRRFGCGWQLRCGDVDGLTDLLLHLAVHPLLVREAGQKARAVLLAHYDRSIGVAHICDILGALSPTTSTSRQELALPATEDACV